MINEERKFLENLGVRVERIEETLDAVIALIEIMLERDQRVLAAWKKTATEIKKPIKKP